MGISSVQVISIPVSDQERSVRFYRDALGFEVINDAEMNDTMRWLQLRPPHCEFTISLVTWFAEMPPGSLKGLVFGVDDIDVVAADLGERGYLVDPNVIEEMWGRYVLLDDPDHNSLILMTPPK